MSENFYATDSSKARHYRLRHSNKERERKDLTAMGMAG
jgi:hypothetical protein